MNRDEARSQDRIQVTA